VLFSAFSLNHSLHVHVVMLHLSVHRHRASHRISCIASCVQHMCTLVAYARVPCAPLRRPACRLLLQEPLESRHSRLPEAPTPITKANDDAIMYVIFDVNSFATSNCPACALAHHADTPITKPLG
jgi:hypothetical protein